MASGVPYLRIMASVKIKQRKMRLLSLLGTSENCPMGSI